MKLHLPKQRNQALTILEVLVVIAVMVILAVLILPPGKSASRVMRMQCVVNLKQIGIAFRIWPPSQDNKYPTEVSVTNGGAMEPVAAGDVAECFRVMSNELSAPKILICPADTSRTCATNWMVDFNRSHVSYFVGGDAEEIHPERLMSGDANLALGGVPVKSGLFTFATNASITWGPGRHGDVPRYFWTIPPSHFVGNLGYADGSVSEVSDAGLEQSLILTSLATNRLAIP